MTRIFDHETGLYRLPTAREQVIDDRAIVSQISHETPYVVEAEGLTLIKATETANRLCRAIEGTRRDRWVRVVKMSELASLDLV